MANGRRKGLAVLSALCVLFVTVCCFTGMANSLTERSGEDHVVTKTWDFSRFGHIYDPDPTADQLGVDFVENMVVNGYEPGDVLAPRGYQAAGTVIVSLEAPAGETFTSVNLDLDYWIYWSTLNAGAGWLKVYISTDGEAYTEKYSFTGKRGADTVQKLTAELPEAEGQEKIYVKVQAAHWENMYGAAVGAITLTGTRPDEKSGTWNFGSFRPTYDPDPTAELLGVDFVENMVINGYEPGNVLSPRGYGPVGTVIVSLKAARGEFFDKVDLALDYWKYWKTPDAGAGWLKVYVSTDGETYTEKYNFTGQREADTVQKLTAELTEAKGKAEVYVKIQAAHWENMYGVAVSAITLHGKYKREAPSTGGESSAVTPPTTPDPLPEHEFDPVTPEGDYSGNWREQFHYSPAENWVNDPNGLVYYNDQWHLFYQYNAEGAAHNMGNMSWGHAVSDDLVTWKELPVAMSPDGGGSKWSGSVVIDADNTSGLFDDEPKGGLVAVYTLVRETQQQAVAYSTDGGMTWTKYGDPVITTDMDPLTHRDFRDPKVFWHEESDQWLMVVAGGPVRLYSSPDLLHWTAEGTNADILTECPDLFPLQVGETGENKWVLSLCGRFYMIGDLKVVDGKWTFVPDSNARYPMNIGPDSYAAQSFYGAPGGRVVMLSWMNTWAYAKDITKLTQTFNGAYTLACELSLRETDDGIRLYQQPMNGYEVLRVPGSATENKTAGVAGGNNTRIGSGRQAELLLTLEPGDTKACGVLLRAGEEHYTEIRYDAGQQLLIIDRSKSGEIPSAGFASSPYAAYVPMEDGKLTMHIYIDRASIEIFVNDGYKVGTFQVFPGEGDTGIELFSEEGDAGAAWSLYQLKSIWKEESESSQSTGATTSSTPASTAVPTNGTTPTGESSSPRTGLSTTASLIALIMGLLSATAMGGVSVIAVKQKNKKKTQGKEE